MFKINISHDFDPDKFMKKIEDSVTTQSEQVVRDKALEVLRSNLSSSEFSQVRDRLTIKMVGDFTKLRKSGASTARYTVEIDDSVTEELRQRVQQILKSTLAGNDGGA